MIKPIRKSRIYLDHNATTPLRAEAKKAMLGAMEVIGNPSSVHREGRAAKAILDRARSQISQAFGVGVDNIIFTSGATEAAALALAGHSFRSADLEHDAVAAWVKSDIAIISGQVQIVDPSTMALQMANSETGVIQKIPKGLGFCDMTQAFGKIAVSFAWTGADKACASAHKLGGPKGIGCLMVQPGIETSAQIKGGGQEMGRRAGTENIIGIAGFGAAAEAAAQDLASGKWSYVRKLRDYLQNTLESSVKNIICIGRDYTRLPNTLCFAAPGWKAETQVMQMDLAGFAISAGSACSSGKVKASKVVLSMGYGEEIANSAVRVSLGLGNTQEEVEQFAEAWLTAHDRFLARNA